MKLTGEFEVTASERLSDAVNRPGEFLQLRGTRVEALSVHHPMLSRTEERTALSKAAVTLLCLVDEVQEGRTSLYEERSTQTAAINTVAFALVADVHLPPGMTLQDHLERLPRSFVALTNVSGLWMASAEGEMHSVQRPFALLNPASILSISMR